MNGRLPVLTYPASSGPRFKKGFIFATCAFVAQFGITGLVAYLQKRELRQKTEKAEARDGDEGQQRSINIVGKGLGSTQA